MVTVVALVAVLAAAALAGRWYLRRVDELGRPRAFPMISVSLLLAISLMAGYTLWRHERLEHRLSVAATALVGTTVEVQCQSWGGSMVDAGGDLGFVKWAEDGTPERRTLIKRDVCRDLRDYLDSPDADLTRDQVVAVHILSHESMHMAGEKVESIAECEAVQRNASTARLLGASSASATRLAQRYWSDVYPHLTGDYMTSDCRAGGPLDEGLPDAPWSPAA